VLSCSFEPGPSRFHLKRRCLDSWETYFLRLLLFFVEGCVFGVQRPVGKFSDKKIHVEVGAYAFELSYLHGLRNPSGRFILDWTDELDRMHSNGDPRVMVEETVGSRIARFLVRRLAPAEGDFAAAVQKHLGDGWLIVSETEAIRFPITRSISYCIVHFKIRGESKNKASPKLRLESG
jgi:hypothetical protein